MQFSDWVAERVRTVPQDRNEASEWKMFGSLPFMSRGHMFVSILDNTLMVRKGPDPLAPS